MDVTTRHNDVDGRFVRAVVVPLAVACVAYGLSWLIDELRVIGPFDRAAFGWIFVIPTWLATAPAAALVWKDLRIRERRLAAVLVAGVVGSAVLLLTWVASSSPACD